MSASALRDLFVLPVRTPDELQEIHGVGHRGAVRSAHTQCALEEVLEGDFVVAALEHQVTRVDPVQHVDVQIRQGQQDLRKHRERSSGRHILNNTDVSRPS